MISVAEAVCLIAAHAAPAAATTVPLAAAAGHVLAADVRADRELPPYERAAMDGIAIAHAAWARGLRHFRVAGIARSGAAPLALAADTDALEIMTGAVVPAGADAVVRVEDLVLAGGVAAVRNGVEVEPWENVHRRGSDVPAGAVLLRRGAVLRAPELAVLASVGQTSVPVSRRPAIAVIATGDELVPPETRPAPHQIRQSNGWALAAMLAPLAAAPPTPQHGKDDADALRRQLAALLETADVLVLNGGVSKGRYDFVPEVLASLGVTWHFREVSQRPGKPFCFGTRADGRRVFALPGNPVSAATCCCRYVLPQLRADAGAPARAEFAVLSAAREFGRKMTLFLPVVLSSGADGRLAGAPVPVNGSGDFAGLAGSDGFLELDPTCAPFAAGTAHPLFRWPA